MQKTKKKSVNARLGDLESKVDNIEKLLKELLQLSKKKHTH